MEGGVTQIVGPSDDVTKLRESVVSFVVLLDVSSSIGLDKQDCFVVSAARSNILVASAVNALVKAPAHRMAHLLCTTMALEGERSI